MRKKKRILLLLTILLLPMFLFSSIKASAATSSSQAGKVVTQGSSLNIRNNTNTSSTILAKAENGSLLTLISRSGSWWRVEYANDKYGYVSSSYISAQSSTPMRVSTSGSNLNVRSSATTSSTKKAALYNGKYVLELSRNNNWSKILYNGNQIGYVSSSYLAGNTTYKSISLSVPSYKQFDSRWGSLKVGNSGSTLKQIGCTTTALAMTESYRRGTTLTPANMLYNLSYTSGGAVYWPSNYSAYTGSAYLTKLYNLLNSGKPALIGAKTSSGGQHWVVVTGHNGSNTLSASNFKINDPGSSYRSNLQEFFNSYPNFYKIMSY